VEKTLATKAHANLVTLIRDKREGAGLTQDMVAHALGEHQSFVARVESGQRRVDVVEFIELGRVLGFDAPKELRNLIESLRK
jgi:ribosome-binding protein aMBF1 (putative translation factor)